MRRCLLLISVLMLLCQIPCCAEEVAGDSVVCSEYMFFMQARGHELTGVCIVNEDPVGDTTGTIVNEFGVKAFDFVISNGKAKVFNVIKPLDKWYIRKVLRGDIAFTFQHIKQGKDLTVKKRKITFQEKGEITVENSKFKIRYTFTPIVANDETD